MVTFAKKCRKFCHTYFLFSDSPFSIIHGASFHTAALRQPRGTRMPGHFNWRTSCQKIEIVIEMAALEISIFAIIDENLLLTKRFWQSAILSTKLVSANEWSSLENKIALSLTWLWFSWHTLYQEQASEFDRRYVHTLSIEILPQTCLCLHGM